MLHDEIAEALVDLLKGIKVTGYKWAPRKIKPICAVVELPEITRTEPDQSEDHIGARDWNYDFPVAFYTELTQDPRSVQAILVDRVAEFISAVDDLKPGPSGLVLNELCTDVKVTKAVPFVQPRGQQQRDLIGYETHVLLLSFQ